MGLSRLSFVCVLISGGITGIYTNEKKQSFSLMSKQVKNWSESAAFVRIEQLMLK